MVRRHGADLRFLVRTKNYKRYTLQAAVTIGTHPEPSRLYCSVIDKESGAFAELPPLPIFSHTDAFADTASIALRDIEISEAAGGSIRAQWSKEIGRDLPSVVPEQGSVEAPFYSKLVKRR